MKALVAFLGLLLIASRLQQQGGDFDVDIQPSLSAPLEGPIALSVTIKYRGERPTQTLALLNGDLDVVFTTPSGWQARENTIVKTLNGTLPITQFKKGESLTFPIYLHDYFTQMTPGRISLPATFRIWPNNINSAEPLAIIAKTVTLEITKTDHEKLGVRIKGIVSRITDEKSKDVKLHGYRSLLGISHPDLVSIFLQALRDADIVEIRSVIQRRLMDIAIQYDKSDLLIDYLAIYGDKHDLCFFEFWKAKGFDLTDVQSLKLSIAKNLWIKIYSLEYYPNQKNALDIFRALQSESDDVLGKLQKIKKKLTINDGR